MAGTKKKGLIWKKKNAETKSKNHYISKEKKDI